jgi:hypothetical protein
VDLSSKGGLIRLVDQGSERNPLTAAEFIGSSSFAAAFTERQRYEVDAGRDEEPILYAPLYTIVEDANLPEVINVNTLGPAGVIFDEVKEGGEAHFVTVGEGNYSITIKQYAAGIEYSKKLFMFNQTWQFPAIERQFGTAHNALMNHIHLYPIISAAYAAANQTAANGTTGVPKEEVYLLTIEDAITNSINDTTHPRRGPYDLLCSTANVFMIERALKRRIQDGIDIQSSAINKIRNIIAYDGWSGTRGKKTVTYTGVTAGKSYLVSGQYRATDYQSYVKQGLQSQRGDGDLSRFIVEQVIYDSWFGMYANPLASVEEITWPT